DGPAPCGARGRGLAADRSARRIAAALRCRAARAFGREGFGQARLPQTVGKAPPPPVACGPLRSGHIAGSERTSSARPRNAPRSGSERFERFGNRTSVTALPAVVDHRGQCILIRAVKNCAVHAKSKITNRL